MTIDLIKFAFVAGEISPNYFGRPDLTKFDLALAEGENWFVDYRGGVSTRPGSEFLDYLKDDDKPIKLIDFKFSSDLANTNVIILGHFYMRFAQDGAYVLETAKNITGLTSANPAVVTSTAHGFSDGDWVKIKNVNGLDNVNNETFIVANKTANTFQLKDAFGNNFCTVGHGAYVSGGTVARIYTVTTPWDSAHLEDLRHHQIRDNIRFTHKNYKIRNLVRTAVDNWTLSLFDFTTPIASPGAPTVSIANGSGTGSGAYAVTAVDKFGNESLPSPLTLWGGSDDYTGATVAWTPVAGATSYNIYRTRVFVNTTVNRGQSLGYVGRSAGALFIDTNIVPDFTRTPPEENNPFVDAGIDYVDVTAGGSNYNNSSTMSFTDANGTGATGHLVIGIPTGASVGPIVGVVVTRAGSGYTAPSITLGGVGSGATFSIHLTPSMDNNPAVGAVFQQRQVFAATENDPLTIWGSRPARLSNFGTSAVTSASDSYEHEIDSDSVAPIRHLVPVRGGLIVINELGIWLLSGTNGAAVTPTNAQADSQAYKGATSLVPLKIDTDVLYQEGQGGAIRLLSYNDINKVYSGVDMSVLANHLFGVGKKIKSWAYSDEPFKLAWAARQDGIGLSFTLLKEQEVYAWMRQTTKGLYLDMLAVQEGDRKSIYTIVQRYVNGRWTKFFERFAPRDFKHVEESWCMDCGLALTPNYGSTTLQVAATEGDNVTVTASGVTFGGGDVGKILRAGGGKMEVITYTDSTHVQVKIIRPITDVVPQTEPLLPRPALPGEWSLDTPVSTLKGLRHLEGQTVRVLADGHVLQNRVVTNGQITIEQTATRIIVGLGYRALLKTLPITVPNAVVEDKRKRVVGIASRIHESRGIAFGVDLDNLYAMKERTNEDWGEPTELQEGVETVLVEPTWDDSGQFYVVQDNPLPATLLGFVVNTEIGDDDDTN